MKRIFGSYWTVQASVKHRMRINLVISEVIHGRVAMTAGNFIFRIWKRSESTRSMVWNMQKHRESDRKFCKNAGIILWKGYDDRTLGNGGNRNTGSTSKFPNGFPKAFIEEFSKGREERFYVICRIQAHRSFMIMAGSRKRQEH